MLRVTEGYRTIPDQAAAHEAHKRWLEAGSPVPVPAGMKDAYAAPPGGSFHGAGRAVDIDTEGTMEALQERLQMTPEAAWRMVRGVMRAEGFTPITKDESGPNVTEAWHYEYRGPWSLPTLNYDQAAMAATLDIAAGADRGYFTSPDRKEIIAQLHRAGYDAGSLASSLTASKVLAALRSVGWTQPPTVAGLLDYVRRLPDKAKSSPASVAKAPASMTDMSPSVGADEQPRCGCVRPAALPPTSRQWSAFRGQLGPDVNLLEALTRGGSFLSREVSRIDDGRWLLMGAAGVMGAAGLRYGSQVRTTLSALGEVEVTSVTMRVPNIGFRTVRADKGQIVVRSYGVDEEGRLWRRTFDRSDRTTTYEVTHHDWTWDNPDQPPISEAWRPVHPRP
jgi:hypothetical protein